ncbi:MAG: hypothetical protein AAFS07_00470 [Pseudomonadota bacterium]
MKIDFEKFFLFQPFQTDALMAEVTMLRNELVEMGHTQQGLAGDLTRVSNTLLMIEEKNTFLLHLLEQTFDVFVPPDPEKLEAAHAEKKTEQYDKLQTAMAYTGAGALGLLLAGKVVLPGLAAVTGFVTGSSRIAAYGSASKFSRLAAAGKAAVALVIVIGVIEMLLRMRDAKKINDHLREKRDEIETQIAEADDLLADHRFAIKEANRRLEMILTEAGYPEDLDGYLGRFETTLRDIGHQRGHLLTARNMLRMGMPKADIRFAIDTLDPAVLDSIEKRLNAEIMLIQGVDPAEVSRRLELTTFERKAIELVLAARGATAAGMPMAQIVETHGVTPAIADLQQDIIDQRIARHWAAIDSDAPLGPVANALLIPEPGLAQLRAELAAKRALAAGEQPSGEPAALAAWEAALPDLIAEAEALKVDGPEEQVKAAATLRLPLALVPIDA